MPCTIRAVNQQCTPLDLTEFDFHHCLTLQTGLLNDGEPCWQGKATSLWLYVMSWHSLRFTSLWLSHHRSDLISAPVTQQQLVWLLFLVSRANGMPFIQKVWWRCVYLISCVVKCAGVFTQSTISVSLYMLIFLQTSYLYLCIASQGNFWLWQTGIFTGKFCLDCIYSIYKANLFRV